MEPDKKTDGSDDCLNDKPEDPADNEGRTDECLGDKLEDPADSEGRTDECLGEKLEDPADSECRTDESLSDKPVDSMDIVLTQPSSLNNKDFNLTEPSAPEYPSDEDIEDPNACTRAPEEVILVQPQGEEKQSTYVAKQNNNVRIEQPLSQNCNKKATEGDHTSSAFIYTSTTDEMCCDALLLSCHHCCGVFRERVCCIHPRCCQCDSDLDDCCECGMCNCDCDLCETCSCPDGGGCDCCDGVIESLGECVMVVLGGCCACLCSIITD